MSRWTRLFLLHPHPVNMNDLPSHRKQQGFDNLEFNFDALGAIFDGKCLVEVPVACRARPVWSYCSCLL